MWELDRQGAQYGVLAHVVRRSRQVAWPALAGTRAAGRPMQKSAVSSPAKMRTSGQRNHVPTAMCQQSPIRIIRRTTAIRCQGRTTVISTNSLDVAYDYNERLCVVHVHVPFCMCMCMLLKIITATAQFEHILHERVGAVEAAHGRTLAR